MLPNDLTETDIVIIKVFLDIIGLGICILGWVIASGRTKSERKQTAFAIIAPILAVGFVFTSILAIAHNNFDVFFGMWIPIIIISFILRLFFVISGGKH